MKWIHLSYSFMVVFVVSPRLRWAHADTDKEEDQSEWEYEPRFWSIDDVALPMGEEGDMLHEPLEEDISPIPPSDVANPHRLHHFIGSKPISSKQIYVNTTCDQFRVDIREAIVCDKKRCDRLDFEWPKYDNQLTIIETTKHGMRFHRADYAFAPKSQQGQTSIAIPINRLSNDKVKFDLFELFKPKPTTTTMPPPSPVNTEPDTTTTAPTENAPPETTTQQPAEVSPDPGLREQDSNSTQLISTFRIDTRRKKQRIVGFGGALSDSTCKNIKNLSPEMAKSLMEDYFGERGLRYNLVRISVGSSDFSTSPYTNNDKISRAQTNRPRPKDGSNVTLLDEDDFEMKNFRLTDEDYLIKIPVVRQAIATSKQDLKVFASLWSPPTWMKNNSDIVHGYLKGDVYGPYYKALAELMLKWLEAYRKNGIEMWGFTGLNEPVTGVKPFIFHNSLGITRDDYITFFKLHLGPMMRQRGFHDVKLMIVDDNRGYMPNWAKTFLRDQEAAKYVSGVASHWYMNDEYENLDFISKYHPDKFILATEACNGYLPFQLHALPGDWDRGVAYMYDITKMMQKNSVGWVDWNMALDLSGGPSWIKNFLDAAVIVNSRRDEYYKSPMFYAIGHFSRFVEPNSIRLDSRLANAKFDYPLEAVAFHTPNNYITIVALNANKHSVPFRIIVDRQLIRVITLRADSFNTVVFKWKRQIES